MSYEAVTHSHHFSVAHAERTLKHISSRQPRCCCAVGKYAAQKATTISHDGRIVERLKYTVRISSVVAATAHDERVGRGRLDHFQVRKEQTIKPKAMNLVEVIEIQPRQSTLRHRCIAYCLRLLFWTRCNKNFEGTP